MFYINPRDMDKEQWLSHHAIQVDKLRIKDFSFEAPGDESVLPCIWVMNPGFTAAGVAFDAAELSRWFGQNDPRTKRYYLVPKESFFALHPEVKQALEEKS